MKILVFVKQVPDTDDVRLDPRTGNLMRDGVQSIINPFDANGVEAALQLKAQCGRPGCSHKHGAASGGRCAEKGAGHGL